MRSARHTRQADQEVGSGIVLVVLCFLAFRLFALLLLQYGGVFGSGSDFDYYFAMAQQTDRGYWPYLSYWSEYPPVFPWLIVGVYRLASIFGNAPASGTFSALLHVILLGFDLGNLLLIYALARRIYGQTAALRSAWVYATLFAPIFVWLGWFDPMPIFWLLLSIWLLVRRNLTWAGVACGIGVVTKIFPGFVLLVAVREAVGLRVGRRGIATVLTFAIPCACAVAFVCLPFVAANPPVFVTSVRSWFSRLPWESFWAIADGYYLFGIVPSLPARLGWPTYTTPELASPILSDASLLVLAGSLAGVYLGAWDRTPARPEALADAPWTVSSATFAVRRLFALPFDLATRVAAIIFPAKPGVAIAGLEVAAQFVTEPSLDVAKTGSGGLSRPLAEPSGATPDGSFDERAFRLVAFSAAIYTAMFLVTSGFSPQFMLWLVPFAVILLPSIGAFVWVSALTLVVIVGERYLYYWYFPPDALVLSGILLVRSLLLAGFLAEVLWQIGVSRAEIWPRLRPAATAGTVVAFLIVGGLMLKTFADGGWGRAVVFDPARVASANLRQSTDQYDAILTFQVADYRYLAPWLGDRAFYLLNDPRLATPGVVEQTMRTLAATHTGFVVVERGSETASERAAAAWLDRYGTQVSASVDKTGVRTTRYQIAPGLAWPAMPPATVVDATIGNDVELLGYSRLPPSAASDESRSIVLYWKPLRPLGSRDLVLTPAGGASRIGTISSTYPTGEWPLGEVVVDQESIPVNSTTLSLGWRARATGQLDGQVTINLGQTAP